MPHSDLRRMTVWLNRAGQSSESGEAFRAYAALYRARQYATKKYRPRINAVMPAFFKAMENTWF